MKLLILQYIKCITYEYTYVYIISSITKWLAEH